MAESMDDILHPGLGGVPEGFPHAPSGWTPAEGEKVLAGEGVVPGPGHWEVVRALQAYFVRHDHHVSNLRELYDALDERFHREGGRRYLFELFPEDPVAQGCRLGGLKPPVGYRDPS